MATRTDHAMNAQPNDPSRAGMAASTMQIFADRWAVGAEHTTGEGVEWVVRDSATKTPVGLKIVAAGADYISTLYAALESFDLADPDAQRFAIQLRNALENRAAA